MFVRPVLSVSKRAMCLCYKYDKMNLCNDCFVENHFSSKNKNKKPSKVSSKSNSCRNKTCFFAMQCEVMVRSTKTRRELKKTSTVH